MSSLNTAEAVIALLKTDRQALSTREVRRGLDFLRNDQAMEGGEAGAWCRKDELPDGTPAQHPDVIRTGLILEAFALAHAASDRHVAAGVDWLLSAQNADGGWGCAREEPTRFLPTCQALLGLMAVMEAGYDIEEATRRGIAFVREAQKGDGFFSLNDSADLLAPAHTIHAVLVLQVAARPSRDGRRLVDDADRQADRQAERRAIDWLLRNQDDARRLVAETFEVGTKPYSFLYVTDSLLIRVLTNSSDRRDEASRLYDAALFSVKDRIEPSDGACYGYRLFTWSTARVITAMSAAAQTRADFPSRPAEYTGTKARFYLTLLMCSILALGAVLGLAGKFSPQVAGFFALIVLCVLLINRFIGEKTFSQLVSSAARKQTGDNSSAE